MGDVLPYIGEPVADRLLFSSTGFAQSAVAAYCDESWDVFYLHLATAVEQVIKACLAAEHPSLIADTRSFDSLLHLCGRGHRAKTPEFVRAVRTITATEAIARVARILDEYEPPAQLVEVLLDTRNAVVHSGHHGKGEAEAVLGDTSRYVEQLLRQLDCDPAVFWGESADMVADHAQRRLSAREASYARRLQAARERYARLSNSMEPAALSAVVAAASPTGPRETFDSAPVRCPACGHTGEMTGFPQPEWEADWDYSDGETYVAGAYVSKIDLQGDGFRCKVCGLDLGPLDLPFAGMEHVTLSEGEYDLDEATRFFEREVYEDDDEIS